MMSARPADLGRYIISIILVSMRGGARNLFKLGLEPKEVKSNTKPMISAKPMDFV